MMNFHTILYLTYTYNYTYTSYLYYTCPFQMPGALVLWHTLADPDPAAFRSDHPAIRWL